MSKAFRCQINQLWVQSGSSSESRWRGEALFCSRGFIGTILLFYFSHFEPLFSGFKGLDEHGGGCRMLWRICQKTLLVCSLEKMNRSCHDIPLKCLFFFYKTQPYEETDTSTGHIGFLFSFISDSCFTLTFLNIQLNFFFFKLFCGTTCTFPQLVLKLFKVKRSFRWNKPPPCWSLHELQPRFAITCIFYFFSPAVK